jgi:methyltransferase (TIGR00027 family)
MITGMARRHRPSLTARNVAVLRAASPRRSVATGDPSGDDRLARSLRAPVPVQLPGMAAYIAARTSFFDDQLLAACERGATQVVILGAGYDGRPVRFRQPHVAFFEVDHPDTQADKRRRLADLDVDATDVRWVELDLGHDRVDAVLATAGFDATVATHFMCEGVTAYLPIAVLRDLLRSVRACAAPGSTLAIDFARPRRGDRIASRALLVATRLGTAVLGEQIVTLLPPDQAIALLTDTGWNGVELAPPTASSPVVFAAATAP